jgi:hypothetical protein
MASCITAIYTIASFGDPKMESLLAETRLTLADLAQGQGVNVSTVWRWTLRGVRGVVLESFSVGARRFTTVEAFQRFVERSTAASPSSASRPTGRPAALNGQREFDIMAAEAELDQAGI